MAPKFPVQWGVGEITSLCFAVAFICLGACLNRKWLGRDRIVTLAANGISLGPLAMILFDPINKAASIFPVDLLQTAMTESRVTLWWAALVAAVAVVQSLAPQRAG